MPDQNDAIQQLLAQYELGDTGGDPHEGSVPVRVAPQQQRPAGIPATKAVPPKDPQTGRFLPAQVQPSAPGAQRQESSEDPIINPETGEPIQHSRALLKHAYLAGFSDAEIDTTPSETLQDLIFTRQREMLEKAVQQPAPNISGIEKPVVKAPEPDPEVSFGEFESDDNLDPKLRAVLKGHLTEQLKKLKAIETRLEETTKRQEQQERASQAKARDGHIDKMLTKHAHFLGNESIAELSEGSPNLAKRRAVLGLASADKSKRSDQEKIDYAVSQLFGAPPQADPEVPQPGTRPTAQQWANGGVPRPTSRKPAPEINDIKNATKAVEQRLAMLNQAGSNGSVDKDDFPE